MAGLGPRTAAVCTIPAVIILISFFFIKRKRKNSQQQALEEAASTLSQSYSNPVVALPEDNQTEVLTKEDYSLSQDNLTNLLPLQEADFVDMHLKGGVSPSQSPEHSSGRCAKDDSPVFLNDTDCEQSSSASAILSSPPVNQVNDHVEQDKGHVDENTCLEDTCHIRDSSNIETCDKNEIASIADVSSCIANMSLSGCDREIVDLVTEGKCMPANSDKKEQNPTTAEMSVLDSAPEAAIQNPVIVDSTQDGEEEKVAENSSPHTPVSVRTLDSISPSYKDDFMDSPPHSAFSDVHSEGSSDSGKGGSDIQTTPDVTNLSLSEDAVLTYEFELPQDLCGRLIGRQGKHVNYVKSRSNANVFIKRHPLNSRLKLCAVEGTQAEIKNALDLIRKRFPLNQFPAVTLTQVNAPLTCGITFPETLQLNLPEGVSCDVILSSMVSAGHFFLQQPTHPTYPSLARLDQCMVTCYEQTNTPELPKPVEAGVICAAPVMTGWYRTQVVFVSEDGEECEVKFVDYGGYSRLQVSSLRQIRSDFMTLPFQASECYLANVQPMEDTWSVDACATFEDLAQGQILQSLIVAYSDDGIPYVHLYRIQGVSTVFINRELVNRGVAQWVEHAM